MSFFIFLNFTLWDAKCLSVWFRSGHQTTTTSNIPFLEKQKGKMCFVRRRAKASPGPVEFFIPTVAPALLILTIALCVGRGQSFVFI